MRRCLREKNQRQSKGRDDQPNGENVLRIVIPSEARNLTSLIVQRKRYSSARGVPRNENLLNFRES